MDKEYRQSLLLQRAQLKERLAKKSQEEHCFELLKELDLASISYEIIWSLPSTTNPTNWLSQNFPIAWWGRVDWEKVPNYREVFWVDYQDLSCKFKTLILELNLGNPIVTLSWTNLDSLSLKLPLNAISVVAETAFSLGWDCWIMSQEHNWCIEKYHEGELCFGYSPTNNKH